MATKTYAGISIEVNEEGFMTNATQWNKNIALAMAKEEGLALSDTHFAVIEYIRDRVSKGEALSIRSVGKSNICDIKGFYELFPGAPLKRAAKYAGVTKPASCV